MLDIKAQWAKVQAAWNGLSPNRQRAVIAAAALAVGLLGGRCSHETVLTSTEHTVDEKVQQTTNTDLHQTGWRDGHGATSSTTTSDTRVSREKDSKKHVERKETTVTTPDGTVTTTKSEVIDDVKSDDVNVAKKTDAVVAGTVDTHEKTDLSVQQQQKTDLDLHASEKTTQTLADRNVLVGVGVGLNLREAVKGNLSPTFSGSAATRVFSVFGRPVYVGARLNTALDIEANIQGAL